MALNTTSIVGIPPCWRPPVTPVAVDPMIHGEPVTALDAVKTRKRNRR
jgi:hypothetical protein